MAYCLRRALQRVGHCGSSELKSGWTKYSSFDDSSSSWAGEFHGLASWRGCIARALVFTNTWEQKTRKSEHSMKDDLMK